MSKYQLRPGYIIPSQEELPSGWVAKKLKDICQIKQGGKFGFTKEKHFVSSGVPAYSAAGQDGYVEVAEFEDTDGVILSAIGANCGRCFFASGEWTTLANTQVIIPGQKLDASYLYYRTNSENYWERSGSAQPFIKPSSVGNSWVAFPSSKAVQKRISEIIKESDRTIDKTEALIEKYQKIKAGLMHDLFTRGIGADGKLRPSREQAPELYQETPIGWIPKEWTFSICADVCEKIIDCKNRTPPITPDGHPVIRTPNVREGMFVDEELVYTDSASYLIWTARGKPIPGDVVITREAPVGEVCKIPERHDEACLGQRMMLYRTDRTKIDNDYFLYALQSIAIQNRLDVISGGSTVGHVRVGDIRDLWIYYPTAKGEQISIAKSLESVSGKIHREKILLGKLQKEKDGLMHDLLTGKVGVKVDQPEAAHV